MGGLFRDPATLAATGLLVASLFNVLGGFINFLADPGSGGTRERLYQLTDVVEIGDVTLLGLAVALLVLTVDPPGGISRSFLLNANAVLAGVVSLFGVVRAVVWLTDGDGPGPNRLAGFLVTIGIAVAAATVGYWAARESFLKEQLHGRRDQAAGPR
jgi:hypothetical protein